MTNTIHTLIITTKTGGLYTILSDTDGTVRLVGTTGNGRAEHKNGTVAGLVILPFAPELGPCFYLGDADPVNDGTNTVLDHDRQIRTGPIDLAILDGVPMTPAVLHDLCSIDHLGVPLGQGVRSDPEFSPVRTGNEGAYLPIHLAAMFRHGGPFAEYV